MTMDWFMWEEEEEENVTVTTDDLQEARETVSNINTDDEIEEIRGVIESVLECLVPPEEVELDDIDTDGGVQFNVEFIFGVDEWKRTELEAEWGQVIEGYDG